MPFIDKRNKWKQYNPPFHSCYFAKHRRQKFIESFCYSSNFRKFLFCKNIKTEVPFRLLFKFISRHCPVTNETYFVFNPIYVDFLKRLIYYWLYLLYSFYSFPFLANTWEEYKSDVK